MNGRTGLRPLGKAPARGIPEALGIALMPPSHPGAFVRWLEAPRWRVVGDRLVPSGNGVELSLAVATGRFVHVDLRTPDLAARRADVRDLLCGIVERGSGSSLLVWRLDDASTLHLRNELDLQILRLLITVSLSVRETDPPAATPVGI